MREKIRAALRYVLAAFMVFGGINHFLNPDFYLHMMPGYMPFHPELVALSGVAEIGLGALTFFNRTKRIAGLLIVAMLIVFFTVHIDMLVHAGDKYADLPLILLWGRIPLQFVLIWWTLWSTSPIDDPGKGA
jgi:uncharacterized membrane protein